MRVAATTEDNLIGVIVAQNTPQNFGDAVKALAAMAAEVSNGETPVWACGGIAGTFDHGKNTLLAAPNLPDFVGKPIRKEFSEALGHIPVQMENDAALAALGESLYGAGRDYSIVGYLTVGTGIGGARVVNKIIDSYAVGFEPGHQIINAESNATLESLISGKSLLEQYGSQTFKEWDDSTQEMFTRYLAIGVHNSIVHWSPDVMIIGGGVILNSQYPIVQLETQLELLPNRLSILPEIKKAELGDHAGLYGALSINKQ